MEKSIGFERFLHDIRHRRDRYRQFIGIMFIVLVSAVGTPDSVALVAGTVFILAGIAVRMWASGHIKKNKVLATDGPYAYVRHPLYVGNILLGIGFSLASGLWWSFPLFILIMIVFYPQAIRHEDAKLHRLFGEDWQNWRQNTHALIPKLQAKGASSGQWSFYQSLRQNGEPIIALILLLCLVYLYVKL
jgi:protein-S-isoprenylcysteine O-methyltransferase Ste14